MIFSRSQSHHHLTTPALSLIQILKRESPHRLHRRVLPHPTYHHHHITHVYPHPLCAQNFHENTDMTSTQASENTTEGNSPVSFLQRWFCWLLPLRFFWPCSSGGIAVFVYVGAMGRLVGIVVVERFAFFAQRGVWEYFGLWKREERILEAIGFEYPHAFWSYLGELFLLQEWVHSRPYFERNSKVYIDLGWAACWGWGAQ
jgi:hypothetical protein